MTMDYETASMLGDSAQSYATDKYSFSLRHKVLQGTDGYSPQAWQDYADLGWLALRLPEEYGGLDADPLVIGSLMNVVGSRLLMEPILASAIVAAGLVLDQGSAEQKARLLPLVADGSLKLCFADTTGELADGDACVVRDNTLNGDKIGILHGDIAGRLIVSAIDASNDGAVRLYVVDPAAEGVTKTAFRLVDGRGAANFRFNGTPAERLDPEHAGSAASAIADAYDQASVAQCAEALGIVRVLVSTTCDYLKIRKQFGKPIGSNQALQHRAVDMFLLQEEIAAMTAAAQRALTQPRETRARLISGAKAYISNAARQVANEAVQMHGGLGITEELDVSHYFRRLMTIAALFGNREEHFSRFLAATE